MFSVVIYDLLTTKMHDAQAGFLNAHCDVSFLTLPALSEPYVRFGVFCFVSPLSLAGRGLFEKFALSLQTRFRCD